MPRRERDQAASAKVEAASSPESVRGCKPRLLGLWGGHFGRHFNAGVKPHPTNSSSLSVAPQKALQRARGSFLLARRGARVFIWIIDIACLP